MDKLSKSLNDYLHKHRNDEIGGKKKVVSKLPIEKHEEWVGRIGRSSRTKLMRDMKVNNADVLNAMMAKKYPKK